MRLGTPAPTRTASGAAREAASVRASRAVVSRSDTGELSLRDGSDDDDEPGMWTGGIVGLIVGILGGPIGVLFGGAIGLAAGSLYDLDNAEETDSDLEHIARTIPNGATA